MATVRLNEVTNMQALSAALPGQTFAPSPGGTQTEMDVYGTQIYAGYAFMQGTFPTTQSGTITRALIDTNDPFAWANLDITNLSYALTPQTFPAFHSGNLLTLVQELLKGGDTILGSSGNDRLLGFDGNDTMHGGGGVDIFDGGAAIDVVDYSGASTGVFASLTNAHLNTGEAAGDTYISIEGLTGADHDDVLYGDANVNFLSGGSRNDVLVGGAGGDSLSGGLGIDTAAYDGSSAGMRADLLTPSLNTGDAAGDTYLAIENLAGSSFNDALYGNDQGNLLYGALNANKPSGNDQLYGRGGPDTLYGYDGNDYLDGGASLDKLYGGAGNDTMVVDSSSDVVTELAGQGSDKVLTSVSYSLPAGQEIEAFATLTPTATTGINLLGNSFAQTITGNAGVNVINGKGGNDTLTGLGGADIFMFDTAVSTSNVRITDFTHGTDKIQLQDSIFSKLPPAGVLAPSAFFMGAAAHDADDRVIYNPSTGALIYDSNGSATGGSLQFATLAVHLATLNNTDFVVF